jgi:mycofactocin precursor
MKDSTSPGNTATLPAPPQDLVEDSTEQGATALVEEELLVEDVSIDGMCGVY